MIYMSFETVVEFVILRIDHCIFQIVFHLLETCLWPSDSINPIGSGATIQLNSGRNANASSTCAKYARSSTWHCVLQFGTPHLADLRPFLRT